MIEFVITEHFILICSVLDTSVLFQALCCCKQALLGSDRRFPVWFRDGIIAELVGGPSIKYTLL